MELNGKPANLQNLLRFAIQHTRSEDPTIQSQFRELDPERKQFLENAMKYMTVDVMEELRKAIEILEDTNATKIEHLNALNVIRDYIDNLDFANNFIKLGGSDILLKYVRSQDHELRVAAIYIVAEMSQNNPFAQTHFTEVKILPLLISYFQSDADTASSSVHAVASVVRHYAPALVEFLKLGGIHALISCLNASNTRAFIKSVFFIAGLATEHEEVRDEFVNKNTIAKLWPFVDQPVNGFDIKIETVLFALSELTKSSKWQPPTDLRNTMHNALNEMITCNKELPECEETVAYAQQILNNLKMK